MKTILKFLIGLFIILFAGVFILALATPKSIEASAETFVKKEIEAELIADIQRKKISTVASFVLAKSEKFGLKVKNPEVTQLIISEFPELIEIVVAKKLSKPENAHLKAMIDKYSARLSSFKIGEKHLEILIEEKYDAISINLKKDILIYSGINLGLFLLLFLFYSSQQSNKDGLILPSILLLMATILSSLIYIFGQDWIYVMLYNQYMGFGYIIYVLVIFLMLLDIAYNQGEITLQILNIITEILAGIVQLLGALLGGI